MTVDLDAARAAVARVREALDSEEGPFSWLTISGGEVAATSRGLSAAAPFLWLGEATVAGREFERVLSAMPGDSARFVEGEDVLTISSGKTVAEVRMATKVVAAIPAVDDSEAMPIDAATLARFEVLSNFISEDPLPTWMNALIVQHGRASACGPGASVYAYASIPDFGADALIPKRTLMAALGTKLPPDRIALTANRATFFWPDGAWLSSGVVDGKVPGTIDRLAEKAATSASPPEITAEWREAFDRVASFAKDEVEFFAEKMVGRDGVATLEDAVESEVPDGRASSKWHLALARLVVANATAWDLTAYPAPSAFVGPVVRGLVTGRN